MQQQSIYSKIKDSIVDECPEVLRWYGRIYLKNGTITVKSVTKSDMALFLVKKEIDAVIDINKHLTDFFVDYINSIEIKNKEIAKLEILTTCK